MAAADTMKEYGPFDEGPLSVEERFAEKGRARQDKIWKLYVQQEFVTSPLFDSNGRPVFVRHRLNNRNEVSHRNHLKKLLCEFGFARGVRGSAWVIAKRRASETPDAGTLLSRDSHELHMMTSATLIEALYECVEDWLRENNKTNILELDDKEKEEFYKTQVGRSVLDGIADVTIFHERTPTDVLEWMKDWGNAFNRAASKPSFVEHLQSLDKIQPALESYLATQFNPPLTSSHRDFEKEVKSYIDRIFPGRFESHREFQNATMFRKRMREHGLWKDFLDWCWQHVDFNSAADLDSGGIYKIANAITRKFLAFNLDTMNTKDPSICTWGSLVMTMLKFALPSTPDSGVPQLPAGKSDWTIPHLIVKAGDVDKLDVLLAPMADSKLSKRPEDKKTGGDDVGEAENNETDDKKKSKRKSGGGAKNKKRKGGAGAGKDDGAEGFMAEVVDSKGHSRQSVFGDDLLNAINYTLERMPAGQRRAACQSFALELGVLFSLEQKLDSAGIEKCGAWSKARKWIKTYLNRTHALRARGSDPDDPRVLDASEAAKADDGNQDEESEAEHEVAYYQRLGACLRLINPSATASFMEDNFGDLSGTTALDTTSMPTLAIVLENHPGCMQVVNKVKKALRGRFGKPSAAESLDSLLSEVLAVIANATFAVFDPHLMEIGLCLLGSKGDHSDMADLADHLVSIPSMATYKNKIKSIVPLFGNFENAMYFLRHRSLYAMGGIQAARDELHAFLKAHGGAEETLQKLLQVLSSGLALIRQIVEQVSSRDVEFAEDRTWGSATEEQRDSNTKAWVEMWGKIIMAVSSVRGNAANIQPRTEHEWKEVKASETQKLGKRTQKVLTQVLAEKMFGENGLDANVVGKLPSEIQNLAQNSESASELTGQLEKQAFKKDFIVSLLTILILEEEKQRELLSWQQWEEDVAKIVESASSASHELEGSFGGILAVEDTKGAKVPITISSAITQSHRHGQVAAAVVTTHLFKLWAACNEGEKALKDVGLDMISSVKNKLMISTHDLAAVDALKLFFVGRCVPLPIGQPAAFLKQKIPIKSKFFKNNGFDLYLVPCVARQPTDIAVKSPLCCAAWLCPVASKETDATLLIEHQAIEVPHGDESIDIELPFLQISPSGKNLVDKCLNSSSKSGSTGKTPTTTSTPSESGKPEAIVALTRPPTEAEVAEKMEKDTMKTQKQAAKKEKDEAMRRAEEGEVEEKLRGMDEQISISAALFRHLMK